MAWISRDERGYLDLCSIRPERSNAGEWYTDDDVDAQWIELPLDADEKLIGRHISWEDEPVEI